MWTYNALIVKVIDGDTLDRSVDLGFSVWVKQRIRLARINAPELKASDVTERNDAIEAKEYLESFPKGTEVVLSTKSKDKYGRYIGEVQVGVINLSDKLLELGLAKVYE